MLRGDAPGGYPALSYFIASEAHFLNFGHELLPNGERLDPPDGVDVAGFWRAFEHTWQWRRTQFDEGRIEVTMTGTEADDESQPGSMGLILPETADTFNDYRFIMGWGDGS
ncbi:hypothetical protein NOR53_2300 [gamma proteobacterium NOR5-3]|nr:hypothetical protein NOR53_2300 [gamma proteobacterium NOR5-3]